MDHLAELAHNKKGKLFIRVEGKAVTHRVAPSTWSQGVIGFAAASRLRRSAAHE